eukprot:2698682-Amphidinium_carterae.4
MGPGGRLQKFQYFMKGPMPYSKFVAEARDCLQLPPLSSTEEQAKASATYRARRTLPTVAGILHLDTSARSILGNWIEANDSYTRLLIQSMAARYDDSKFFQTYCVKMGLQVLLRKTILTTRTYDFLLTELVQHAPKWEEVRQEVEAKGQAITADPKALTTQSRPTFALTPSSEHTGLAIPQPSEEEDVHSATEHALGDESSVTVVSSSSDNGALLAAHIEWVTPKEGGRLHICSSTDMSMPMCGTHIAHKDFGKGLHVAVCPAREWCSRCLARLDGEVADAVRKYDP